MKAQRFGGLKNEKRRGKRNENLSNRLWWGREKDTMGTIDISAIITALTSAASSAASAFCDIIAAIAPPVLGIAAGVIGLRLVISLFRQAT